MFAACGLAFADEVRALSRKRREYSMVAATNGQKIGHIVQVIGSTFDVEFEEGHLPEIYNALKIDEEYKGVKLKVTGEVQQHLGGNRVRAVALGSTEG